MMDGNTDFLYTLSKNLKDEMAKKSSSEKRKYLYSKTN